MRVRAALAARRTLVKLLLSLASAYAIALVLTRESTDIVVEAAFKKVIRKVHPDKGGRNADAQKLNAAKEAWDKCRRPKSRPQSDGAPPPRAQINTGANMEPADPEQLPKIYAHSD